MTAWQDPPLTRREARERRAREDERRAQQQSETRRARRAGTTEVTPAGQIPTVEPAVDSPPVIGEPAAPDPSANDDTNATRPVRPVIPRYDPASFPPDAETGEAESVQGEHGTAEPPSPPEHTLTRRQLRAMREAEAAKQTPSEPTAMAAPERVEPFPTTSRQDSESSPAIRRAPQAPDALVPRDAGHPPADESASRQDNGPVSGPESFDRIIARASGSSGTTTTANALILPSVPTAADATGPLTRTGEVLVTGSIDLPRTLGSTGRHPTAFDSPANDHLYDQSDTESETPTAAPVSASRAVSTHTSEASIAPRKGRGVTVPTVLAIAAAALAVGVVGLLVAGMFLGLF